MRESPSESRPAKRRQPLSVWELPQLLQSVHAHRKARPKTCRERPHFAAILASVYRNRFAVASQIQRRFREYLPSDRTARRHLAEMEALGWLDVAPTLGTSPLWPKVYFVTRSGVKQLREALGRAGREWTPGVSDRRRNEGYGSRHVLHELFVTEYLLSIWEEAQRDAELELLCIERRSLVRHAAFRFPSRGRMVRLTPDAMFLVGKRERGMICSTIEIDMGTMGPRQLGEKFGRYETWAGSSGGQDYLIDLYRQHGAQSPRPTFRIHFVCADLPDVSLANRTRTVLAAAEQFPAVKARLRIRASADELPECARIR